MIDVIKTPRLNWSAEPQHAITWALKWIVMLRSNQNREEKRGGVSKDRETGKGLKELGSAALFPEPF